MLSRTKLERKLNVYGAGLSQDDQTGFNRSYYSDKKEEDLYLTHGGAIDDDEITGDVVHSFASGAIWFNRRGVCI